MPNAPDYCIICAEVNIQGAVDRHIKAGGYVLEGVALWDETVDGETDGRPGAPVDLGDLLRMVEQRLPASDARAEFEQRPDLYILLRRCRVYRCNANGLRIRPRFVSFGVQFDCSSFARATFGDSASFKYAKFGDSASLKGATFGKGGSFAGANLNRAKLFEADLRGCDLRDVRGLVLNSTRVKDAQFSPLSNDPWSVLRRAYTGPRLIFNLLFLTAFFLPYVARTGYWVGVNRTELAAARVLAELREYGASPHGDQGRLAGVLERAFESIARRLPGPENPDSRASRVWRLVIGADRGTWFWVSAILLLAYNVLRALLTMFVAPMRDEEERSGVSPAYHAQSWGHRPRAPHEKEQEGHEEGEGPPGRIAAFLGKLRRRSQPLWRHIRARWWDIRALWWAAYSRWTEAYRWLIWPHYVVTGLFWLAVASFAWNAWHWLMLDVWLPAATNAGW